MDSDGTCENSQVSASKNWLTLAALTCNWQLKLANFRKFHRCPWASMVHMDASKAFDRMNHYVLFDKLLKRGVPLYVVRILIFWYTSQTM